MYSSSVEPVVERKIGRGFSMQPEIDFVLRSLFPRGDRGAREGGLPSNQSIVSLNQPKAPDLVLVYRKSDAVHDQRREFFENELVRHGLILEKEQVLQTGGEELIFIKISAPFALLCRQAEELRLNVPLRLQYAPYNQYLKQCFDWFRLMPASDSKITGRLQPQGLQWPFQRTLMPICALTDTSTFFSPTQRIEVVWKVLQNTRCYPFAPRKRGIKVLLADKIYDGAYPPHDGILSHSKRTVGEFVSIREELQMTWASWRAALRTQPIHVVRYYFGEKIAFYFAFMDFYTKALIFPSICGIVGFVYGLTYDKASHRILEEFCNETGTYGSALLCPLCAPPDCQFQPMSGHDACGKAVWAYKFDNPATLVVSCVVCFWASIFYKFWKRKEARYAFEWGTHTMAQHFEQSRPQYDYEAHEERANPITAEVEPYVMYKERVIRKCISTLCTMILLSLFVGCLAVLTVCRIKLYGVFQQLPIHYVDFARYIVHGLIFLLVCISEKIYHPISERLTEFERPRTESQFIQTFLWKSFLFQLLSEFLPIFTAAFVKGNTVGTPNQFSTFDEMCELGGCMSEVVELTAILLVARLLLGNFVEIAYPAIKNAVRRGRSHKHQARMKSCPHEPQYMQDFLLNRLEMDGVCEEFMEMMVQLAFTTVLIPVFPLAPFICLINNIIEIRLDAQKFVKYNRRPLPSRAKGIEIWNKFIDVILKVAIIVNAALICFTSGVIPRLYYAYTHGNLSVYGDFVLTPFNISEIPNGITTLQKQLHLNFYSTRHTNDSICYFEDIRYKTPPHSYRPEYWQIMVVRMVVFSAFVCVFFIFQWLLSAFVNDVPRDVEIEILRREHIVKKCMDMRGVHRERWRLWKEQSTMSTNRPLDLEAL